MKTVTIKKGQRTVKPMANITIERPLRTLEDQLIDKIDNRTLWKGTQYDKRAKAS